jgi:hypothetical protein
LVPFAIVPNSIQAPWNLHRFSTSLCYDGG